MNLKMSLWDSIIWLVKLGEHDNRMDLKWEDPELGTDARIRKWRTSKPSHSVGSSIETHHGTAFLSLPLSSPLCPCPECYLSTQCWSQLCLPRLLKILILFRVTLKYSRGYFSTYVYLRITYTTTKKHVLSFSSLQLLKCLSNASLS